MPIRSLLRPGSPRPRRSRQSKRALAALVALPLTLAGALLEHPFAQAQAPATSARQAQPALERIRLTAGIHVISAEVAATAATRARGLMYRTTLAANAGMLFVFERPAAHCFWMRNTFVALSIAFVADDGRIVNIADMAPQTEDSHCAVEPVRFALEMNQGWFERRGFAAGARISGPPFAPAAPAGR